MGLNPVLEAAAARGPAASQACVGGVAGEGDRMASSMTSLPAAPMAAAAAAATLPGLPLPRQRVAALPSLLEDELLARWVVHCAGEALRGLVAAGLVVYCGGGLPKAELTCAECMAAKGWQRVCGVVCCEQQHVWNGKAVVGRR